MSTEDYRPASSIEPGPGRPLWQVRVDDQWLTVDAAVETEQHDGARLIWFCFTGHPPAVAAKTDLVLSRILEEVH